MKWYSFIRARYLKESFPHPQNQEAQYVMLCKVGNLEHAESTMAGNIIIFLILADHKHYITKMCLSAELGGIAVRERNDNDMKMKACSTWRDMKQPWGALLNQLSSVKVVRTISSVQLVQILRFAPNHPLDNQNQISTMKMYRWWQL